MVKNKKCRFTVSEYKNLNDRRLLLYSVRSSSIKVFMQCEAWNVSYTLKYIYLRINFLLWLFIRMYILMQENIVFNLKFE